MTGNDPPCEATLRDEAAEHRHRCGKPAAHRGATVHECQHPECIRTWSERQAEDEAPSRTPAAVLAYVQDYGHDPCTRQAVGKAVNRVADRALVETRVYPHALRATAAQQLADAGLTAHRLCNVLGWKDERSARPYVDASKASVDRALEETESPWWIHPDGAVGLATPTDGRAFAGQI
jgi:site-specific recombinase XerD